MAAEIHITPLEPGRFGVELREGTTTTSHRVAVPDAMLDDLGLLDVEPAAVVEESFSFLLEREPPGSILRDFALDDIARYFPEYYDELRARLAG